MLLALKTTKIRQTASRYNLQRLKIAKEYMEVQYTWMMWKMYKFLEVMFSEITMLLKRAALSTLIAQQIKTMTLHNVL